MVEAVFREAYLTVLARRVAFTDLRFARELEMILQKGTRF